MTHKCDGCKFKGEHQEMMFRPFGVCLKETDLAKAEAAYNAKVCPHEKKQMTEAKIMEFLNQIVEEFPEGYASCIIDPINRKNAEIRRLKKYDEERDIRLHAKLTATARAEAIKEFAERLKARYWDIPMWGKVAVVFMEEIAKEMGVEL